MKLLFILKKNEAYGFYSYCRRSSGLYNSTRFIVESLESKGLQADIVEVQDNNDIDREVTKYRPDAVIIEALWVVPEKFEVLRKLHPKVQWHIHLHSHMPFLALEGIAMNWIIRYAEMGIGMIANSPASYEALLCILNPKDIIMLPNVYLSTPRTTQFKEKDAVDIGCFGAIRPLKNQLLQALAAIRFAVERDAKLRFHINATRVETGGEPVLKNLRQLFELVPNAQLIEHDWQEPEAFLDLLQTMDMGMQVSLTETFNVVTADYVTAGIPIVTSKEVVWVDKESHATDDSTNSIIDVMYHSWANHTLIRKNQMRLLFYSEKAQGLWFKFATGT